MRARTRVASGFDSEFMAPNILMLMRAVRVVARIVSRGLCTYITGSWRDVCAEGGGYLIIMI